MINHIVCILCEEQIRDACTTDKYSYKCTEGSNSSRHKTKYDWVKVDYAVCMNCAPLVKFICPVCGERLLKVFH